MEIIKQWKRAKKSYFVEHRLLNWSGTSTVSISPSFFLLNVSHRFVLLTKGYGFTWNLSIFLPMLLNITLILECQNTMLQTVTWENLILNYKPTQYIVLFQLIYSMWKKMFLLSTDLILRLFWYDFTYSSKLTEPVIMPH